MRETTKLVDDVLMQLGKLGDGSKRFLFGRGHGVSELVVKRGRLCLDPGGLRVLQRHVEKHLLDRREALVLFVHSPFDTQSECELVH